MREYRLAYKLRYPERVKASKERYRRANLGKWAAWTKQWRAANPDMAKLTEQKYLKTDKGANSMALKRTRRKALLSNCATERYNRLDIYKRDGGMCCICLSPIDLSLPARHPRSFTIQHHIPISRGGADAPDNLGVAHYSCNSRIGNRSITHGR